MNSVHLIEKEILTYEKRLKRQARENKQSFPLNEKSIEFLWQVEPFLIQMHQLLHQEYGQSAFMHKPSLSVRAGEKEVLEHEQALDKELARMRLVSFGQGYLVAKNNRRMTVDLPLQMILCGRAVSRIAYSYGFNLDSPIEAMYAMRLLNYAYLPEKVKWDEWKLLFTEVYEHEEGQPFYRAKEEVISEEIAYSLVRQGTKWGLVHCMNHTKIPGRRIAAGIVTGVSSYRQLQAAIIGARFFYQKRWLWKYEG